MNDRRYGLRGIAKKTDRRNWDAGPGQSLYALVRDKVPGPDLLELWPALVRSSSSGLLGGSKLQVR